MNVSIDPTAALEKAREELSESATLEQQTILANRNKAASALEDLRKELIFRAQTDGFHPVVFARDNSATLVGLTHFLAVIDSSAELKAARAIIAPLEAKIAEAEEAEAQVRADLAAAKQAMEEAKAAQEAKAKSDAAAHPLVAKLASGLAALVAKNPKTAQKLGLS